MQHKNDDIKESSLVSANKIDSNVRFTPDAHEKSDINVGQNNNKTKESTDINNSNGLKGNTKSIQSPTLIDKSISNNNNTINKPPSINTNQTVNNIKINNNINHLPRAIIDTKTINTPNGTIALNTKAAIKPAVNANIIKSKIQSTPPVLMKKATIVSKANTNSTTIPNRPTPTHSSNNVQQKPIQKPIINNSIINKKQIPLSTNQHQQQPPIQHQQVKKPVYFHPIAIKPKPIQPVPVKVASKKLSNSTTGLRLNSASTIVTSSTPTTSKNWVLPPRPKPKKALKKKEKKIIKKVQGPSKLKITSGSSPLSSNLVTQVINTADTNNVISNKVLINKKKVDSSSLSIKTLEENTNPISKSIDNPGNGNIKILASNSNLNSNKKIPCIPGIKSVQLDTSTGKVTINSQIHSNINLHTNNERDLKVQLQHVTCENDNLKKILLKLNKEIQNLKLEKEKCTNKDSYKDTFNDKAINKDIQQKDKIKKLIDSDIIMDDLKVSAVVAANTIDPVNLSYNLDSKRQKVVNLSLDPKATVKPSFRSIDSMQQNSIKQTQQKCEKNIIKKDASKQSTKQQTKSKSLKSKTCKEGNSYGSLKIKSKTNNNKILSISPTTPSPTITGSTNTTSVSAGSSPLNSELKSEEKSNILKSNEKSTNSALSTTSIVSKIATILSRSGINLLGLGGITSITNNNLQSQPNILSAILKQEDIMKKLKEVDRKEIHKILKANNDNVNIENIDISNNIDLNLSLNHVKTNSVDKNIQSSTIEIDEEDDAELLRLIDAELSLDQTLSVKDKAKSKNLEMNNIPKYDGNFETNMEMLRRGNLMDFNAFNGGDPIIGDDDLIFTKSVGSSNTKNGNSISSNNDNELSTLGMNLVNNISIEQMDVDGDDLMMY